MTRHATPFSSPVAPAAHASARFTEFPKAEAEARVLRTTSSHRAVNGQRGAGRLLGVGTFPVLGEIQTDGFVFGIDPQANNQPHDLQEDERGDGTERGGE